MTIRFEKIKTSRALQLCDEQGRACFSVGFEQFFVSERDQVVIRDLSSGETFTFDQLADSDFHELFDLVVRAGPSEQLLTAFTDEFDRRQAR
jgi:hypothetical protein